MSDRSQPPIGDYALLGDGRCAALVSRAGAVDWLCWPRFDSAPWFGALLDPAHGGSWRITPTQPATIMRAYVERTNVLETRFRTPDGEAVLVDTIAVASEQAKRDELVADHELLRFVRCEAGEIDLEVVVEPRPDFGRARVRSEDAHALGIRWHLGTTLVTLCAEVPLHLDDCGVVRTMLRLRAGESVAFSLVFDADAPAIVPVLGNAARARIDRSIAWWREWIGRARYEGPDREAVLRGALALKLLAYAPSGALIAAPTTSLPECDGGDLNWDYRYCWLRDASFTARVFLELGYVEDAEAFCAWLLHTTRLTRPELRVIYDVYGNSPHDEYDVPGVSGYRGSTPVRIGNAARAQRQTDMYGEVIDAVAQLIRVVGAPDRETQRLLRDFGEYVTEHWALADSGIWEPRGPLHRHTHSRVACWVVFDRLLDLSARGLIDRIDTARFAGCRDAIRRNVEDNAFDSARGCYVGDLDTRELDASVLLMSYYGFHEASSARMRSTYLALEQALGVGPGLFLRYEHSRRKHEGAFWICSYWAVDHLARGGGSLEEARQLFREATSYANDVGLMAEEIDPASGAHLGNFPQAYTHVGLVSAALSLEARK